MRTRKPHENGVSVEREDSGAGWHWAATSADARLRYADVVARISDAGPDVVTRIQLVELGQFVEETTLGRDGAVRARASV